MTQFIDTLVGIFQSSGFARFGEPGGYLYAIMICVGCFLLYLAIVKEFARSEYRCPGHAECRCPGMWKYGPGSLLRRSGP